MARIAEKLKRPVIERLDLTRHYITFDCDFACYMVLNPSSADNLEGSDVVSVPIGSWQVDGWSFLSKESYPNRAGFSAVFVYDEDKVNPPDTNTPQVRYSDVDIAHAVSGLRGQPVNITQFTCTEAMPVQITTPDKEPLTVSTSGVMYSPDSSFGTEKEVLDVSGFASELSDDDKAVLSPWLSDVSNHAYEIDLARLSLNARFGKELLRLFPSGVGTLVNVSSGSPSACIPFSPNRLVSEFGYDKEKKKSLEKAVSDAESLAAKLEEDVEAQKGQVKDCRLALSEKSKVYSDAVAENVALLENGCIPPSLFEAIKKDVWASWCSSTNWNVPTIPSCAYFRVPSLGESLSVREKEKWDFISTLLPSDILDGLQTVSNSGAASYLPLEPYTLAFCSDARGKLSVTYVTKEGTFATMGGYKKADGSYATFALKSVTFEDFDHAMQLLGAWSGSGFNADWWQRWVDNNIFNGSFEHIGGAVGKYKAGVDSVPQTLEKSVNDASRAVEVAEIELKESVGVLETLSSSLEDAVASVPVRKAELEEYLSSDDSVMFCWKKALAAIVISSSILALPLICASCDDSASSSEEEIEQVEAKDKGSRDEINDLRSKYDWSLPENWIRSHTYYSADNVNGYDADVINFTFQQNWQGKNLYLARNFKKENGEILVNGDIIFYFDDKLENSDGYYIYYNKLPLDN